MDREIVETLLVEDSQIEAVDLAAALEVEDFYEYRIKIVPSIAQAEHALATGIYSLCVLDLILENGEGVEMIRRVRFIKPHIPLVVVTGLSDREIEKEAIDSMADAFLFKKNLNHSHFRHMVKQAIFRVRRNNIKRAVTSLQTLQMELKETVQECLENPHAPPFAEVIR